MCRLMEARVIHSARICLFRSYQTSYLYHSGAQYKDLQTFLALFAPQWSGRSFDVISVNGGTNLQNETVANVAK